MKNAFFLLLPLLVSLGISSLAGCENTPATAPASPGSAPGSGFFRDGTDATFAFHPGDGHGQGLGRGHGFGAAFGGMEPGFDPGTGHGRGWCRGCGMGAVPGGAAGLHHEHGYGRGLGRRTALHAGRGMGFGPGRKRGMGMAPGRGRPLLEAANACENRKEGDGCTFTIGDYTVESTCAACPRLDGKLVCHGPKVTTTVQTPAAPPTSSTSR